MNEEWLMSGAMVPVDMETTAALVAEIKRLIDVVGGMALAQSEQDCVGWFGYDTGLRLWFETNKGDDDAIPLYKDAYGQPEQEREAWQDTRKTWVDVPLKNVLKEKRIWVGLTDEQMLECNMDGDFMVDREIAKLNVQAKLKEKNT